MFGRQKTTNVRKPAVAGTFYPGSADEIHQIIQGFLAEAEKSVEVPRSPEDLRALIVPHAGYIYSGPVAASAYVLLRPLQDKIKRVVLFGPAHYVPVQGLAVPSVEAFATPLGEIPLDRASIEKLLGLSQVTESDTAHAPEHSLEVQLPFLQEVLGRFELVPLTVGRASPDEVCEVIEMFWNDSDTLILISSDLSHYHPYEEARAIDQQTAEAIIRLQGPLKQESACGGIPVSGLLMAASRHQAHCALIDLRNSGDIAGDRSRVVGYGAFSISRGKPNGA